MNKGYTLLCTFVLMLLTSSISHALSIDTTYNTILVSGGDTAVQNDCFDLDLFINETAVRTYLKGQGGNVSKGVSVSCASPEADIMCVGNSGGTGSNARWQTLNDLKITEYDHPDPLDAYGLTWVGDSAYVQHSGQNEFFVGVTNQGHYYRIRASGYGGQPTWCYQAELLYKNVTYAPYFNYTAVPLSNYQIESFTLSDNYQPDYIYISPLDLGVIASPTSTGVIKYHGTEDRLYLYNGTESKFGGDIEKTDDLTLLDNALISAGGNCLYPDLYVTDTTRDGISDPPTAFNMWCLNTSDFFLPYENSVMALAIINHTDVRDCPILGFCGIEIDYKIIWFDNEYFSITDVSHTPESPLAGSSVTINWITTQESDSRLYWRSAPSTSDLTNFTSFSAWTSKYNGSNVYYHSVIINGSSLLENRYYQFYVESNRTTGSSSVKLNDTNGGIYYNFTIFASTPTYTDQDLTYNITGGKGGLRTHVGHLEENLNMPENSVLNALFFMLSIFFSAITFVASRKPEFAVGVFVVFMGIFSVGAVLPPEILLFIGVVFSIVLSVFIRKMIS